MAHARAVTPGDTATRKAPAPPRTARGLGLALLGLAPIGFLVVFFAWPVLAIIGRGFAAGGLDVVLGDARTWQLAGFTVASAAASTLVAVLAGLPVAFLLGRVKLPGVGLARTLVLVPFVLPTVVVGLAFRALWPDGGVLPIVLANAFFNVAVVARTVAGLWARLDSRTTDAARALGASPWRAFRSVTLPALAPAIASAAAVVFLFCATSFGVVLILGGAKYRTLETEIYLRTVDLLDLSGAAALSLIQFTAVVAALVLGGLARRRKDGARIGAAKTRRPRGGEWTVVGAAGVVLALLLTPIVALLVESVSTSDGWSLAGYRALTSTGEKGALQVSGWDAAVNSLKVAVDATLLALAVGVLASVVLVALRRSPARSARGLGETMDAVLMLPLGVSAVTVGFGYLVTLDALPGDLRTSPYLVPLAQALVIIPLIVRMVLPVLRSVDVRLRQAASTLGASPLRVWREIDLPLALRPLVAAAGFGFVVALGEFGATSFLARPTAPTLPVAIASLMGRPGELNNQMAYAACALLMLVTVLAVALIDRLGAARGRVGEF
jgi:thiamine transport system permease protein